MNGWMAMVTMGEVLPGWKGTEGVGPGCHQSGPVSLFDEGSPLPTQPSLTHNSLDLGKKLPTCPRSQPQAARACLMSCELLHRGNRDGTEGNTDLGARGRDDCKAGHLGLEILGSGLCRGPQSGSASH